MRMGALLAACVVSVSLAVVGHAAGPTSITVRFIDARNGKPYVYGKAIVEIMLYKVDPGKGFTSLTEARANLIETIRQSCNANGELRFTLPIPKPGVIEIPAYIIGCGPGRFDTQEVIEKGVVGKNECRTKFAKKNVKFEAKPGEIIYFVAPLDFWERLHHAVLF